MLNCIRDLRLGFRVFFLASIFSGIILINAPRSFSSDYQSPRTAALGGAGHAGPLLNDAIYLNPSYAAFLPTYAISGNYSWANFQDGSYKYKIQNASIQDGRSELFQAGVAYTHEDQGTFIHLGTAKAAISQRLGIGIGGKAFFPAGNNNHIFDSNFSACGVLTEWIQSSLIVDNLAQTSLGKQYGLYRDVTVGTKFNFEKIFIAYIDPHYTPDIQSYAKFGYEMGGEWPLMSDFLLRGGYFHNSNIPTLGNGTHGNGFGLGFGFLGPKISIDYGLSRVLQPMVGTVQVIGFTAYM